MFEQLDGAVRNMLCFDTRGYRHGPLTHTLTACGFVYSPRCMRFISGPGGGGLGTRSVTEALQYVALSLPRVVWFVEGGLVFVLEYIAP